MEEKFLKCTEDWKFKHLNFHDSWAPPSAEENHVLQSCRIATEWIVFINCSFQGQTYRLSISDTYCGLHQAPYLCLNDPSVIPQPTWKMSLPMQLAVYQGS